jgi:hypothetical protein
MCLSRGPRAFVEDELYGGRLDRRLHVERNYRGKDREIMNVPIRLADLILDGGASAPT